MLNLRLWQERFREHLVLRQAAPSTLRHYAAELAPLFEYLDVQGVEELPQVTREHVDGYRLHLFYRRTRKGRPLSLRHQSGKLCAVKAFFRFLARDGWLLTNPAAELELPRPRRDLPPPLLSEREVERLLEAPDVDEPVGRRDRAILELLYATGLRNAELCGLSLDDVDLERKEVRVRRGKGGKSRVVPMGEEAVAWLEEYLLRGRPRLARSPSEKALFLSWRGRPLEPSALVDLVFRAARAAGITRRVTPHLLRHCCATHMLRGGAGLRHLQQFLGHAKVVTTQRYTQVELSDLHRVLRRCHPRERSRDAEGEAGGPP